MKKLRVLAVVFAAFVSPTLLAATDDALKSGLISRAASGLGLPVSSDVNLCEGVIEHKDPVVAQKLAKPGYLKPYIDPAFGTKVTRISESVKGAVVKPLYSTIQSWNADESRMVLYHTGQESGEIGHHLYDGKTYRHLRKLDIVAKDVEQVFWHHKDPNILFYVSAYFEHLGKLIKYNVETNKKVELAEFGGLCGEGVVPTSGNGVMMQPLDDDLFGFRCSVNNVSTGFSYRVSTGELQKLELGGNSGYNPWTAPMPSTSGKYYFVTDKILEKDLQTVRFTMDLYEFHSHSSLGQMSDGSDALFTTAFDASPKGCDGGPDKGVGSLVIHDFERKTCEVVVGEFNGYGYPGSGTHVSAVGHKKPGWVLMSTISYGQFDFHTNNRPAPVLFSEIYLVNTDRKKRQICRVAHHRSFGKAATGTSYHAYFGEPHATLSPSGTRLVFGSDWYGSGAVDSYVIELPSYKK